MNILITSVGRRSYLVEYFQNALKGSGYVHVSNSYETYAFHQADAFTISPEIFSSDYIPFLIRYCKSNSIDAIISLFDIDLPVLAKNRNSFENIGVRLIVSDYNVTKICNDKWLSSVFLKEQQILQPLTYKSLDGVKFAISSGDMNYPLIIKPRWGMGSIGVYRVDEETELDVLYRKTKRDIFDSYLKYESASASDECVVIQEFISGQEYGIEVLNDLNGVYVTTFAKRKLAMRAGETDEAITIKSERLEEIGRTIGESLKHVGLLDVDCIIDDNDRIYILDMNCRFGGQYPFSHNAGIDVPSQMVYWLDGKSTKSDFVSMKQGVRSCKKLVPSLL